MSTFHKTEDDYTEINWLNVYKTNDNGVLAAIARITHYEYKVAEGYRLQFSVGHLEKNEKQNILFHSWEKISVVREEGDEEVAIIEPHSIRVKSGYFITSELEYWA